MHEHAMEIREANCVPREAKNFFIPVVHSSLGVMGHVTASEFPSQEGRASSRGTRGSSRAPLSRRQNRSHGTRDSTEAYLVKEARSGAKGHVAALEHTSTRR
jgi:hypothetical protein